MTRPPKRVLFVCLGNACRSQMAEAFARVYGADALVAASAGITPAMAIPPDTVRAMAEKQIDLRGQFPKSIRHLGRSQFDLVVNMTGFALPDGIGAPVEEWIVPDPVAMKYEEHCTVRDEIERLVMDLILKLRREQRAPRFRGQGSGRLKT
ncbi:MAG: arsenate reductase ArsC [Bryobacteraceae bacterium]|jgi:arsenate reductase